MHDAAGSSPKGSIGKSSFLHYISWNYVIWPAVCLILAAAVWGFTFDRMYTEKADYRAQAFQLASSVSQAYAGQAERSIMQIDQMLLNLQYYWRETKGNVDLAHQKELGVFPSITDFTMTVVDRQGQAVTSTLPLNGNNTSVANRDHFIQHKQSPSLGLLISGPVAGIISKRPVLLFSRRIEAADGSFDGIIVVAVQPSFLASFTGTPSLGNNDILELRRSDGTLIVTKSKNEEKSQADIFRSLPDFHGKQGVTNFPDSSFLDKQPRIVAWTRLERYPFITVVSISGINGSELLTARLHEHRAVAAAISTILIFAAFIGTLLQGRRAHKLHYKAEIDKAYRLATDHANEGFYMLRPVYAANGDIADFMIADCNEKGASYYGTTREEALGNLMSSYFKDGFAENILPTYRKAMETGFVEGEFKPSRHSTLRPEWVQRRIFRSGDGLAVTVRDITEKKMYEFDLVRLANIDPVTSLPNRHWLMNQMPKLLDQAKEKNRQMALLFVDLDDFKLVNDTLGHAIGDVLLNLVATRLKTAVRPEDSVVRLGGDEFTVILEQISSDDEIALCADRIIAALSHPFILEKGRANTVHASIGISVFPRDGQDPETLLKHADIAMYAVKENGKRSAQFFHPHLSDVIVQRQAMLQAIERGIDNDEFVLYFQPRVDTQTGELLSMEALLRWIDPQIGMVSPDKFIPFAEESGLISALGEIVIRKSCEHLAEWRSQGLSVKPISINVSPYQFSKGKISTHLASYLPRHVIAPSLIEVEITESAMLGEEHEVAQELAAIERLGIKMAVDDFGTGYSSLSQLKRLNVSCLKVDQSLTAQLCTGTDDEAFFRGIVSMAHAINISVVAEGVETMEQLLILQQLSCDEVQGYFISRPVPAADVPHLIRRRFFYPLH